MTSPQLKTGNRQSRQNWIVSFLLSAFLSVSFAAAVIAESHTKHMTPANGTLAIEIDKGTLLRLDRPASEVFIVNPEIADIQVKSPKIVYIFGKKRGETSFYALDDKDDVIYSTNVSVTQSLTVLRETLAELLPDVVIETKVVGSMVLLRGYVTTPEEAATADQLAKQFIGEEFVLNQLTVVQPTQVNLRVRFAEVSRSVIKELGVSFESLYAESDFSFGLASGRDVVSIVENPFTGGPQKNFLIDDSGNTFFGDIITGGLDLNYAIDALDQEGFLTVLAEPNLTTLSGETAYFLAGGEFPVPVPARDGIAIEFREFGVSLEFTPTVMTAGRISMRVRPEVSDLSTAGSIVLSGISIPSISTRRAETTVELGSGQSFAIAGLLQNETRQEARKFPGLGDIPILGALFRNDNLIREETELLIVVTPYLVRPVSERKLALPTDGFIIPSDLDRYLGGKRWAENKGPAPTAATTADGPTLKKRAGFRLD